jgi:hypothetical protein
MTIVREEAFRPVSPITTFSSVDEAIQTPTAPRWLALRRLHQPDERRPALGHRPEGWHRQYAGSARLSHWYQVRANLD